MAHPTTATTALSRRDALKWLGGVVVGTATVAGTYAAFAVPKGWPPFGAEEDTSIRSRSSSSVAELSEGLSSESAAVRYASIEALGEALAITQDRSGAVAGLVAFLTEPRVGWRSEPGPNGRAPQELSRAFELLGKSGVSSDLLDLRHADLSGLEVDGAVFPDGITLFGANLRGAYFTNCSFGSANWGQVHLDESWFAYCSLNSLNLIDSWLNGAYFGSTTLSNCILAGANLSAADFGAATFDSCDFDGRTLVARKLAFWDGNSEPVWPPGYVADWSIG